MILCSVNLLVILFLASQQLLNSRVQADKLKSTLKGYVGVLEDGTLPIISVPVCLIGFCGSGKSSLCRLLTATKHSPVANNTKVASSISVTPHHTKYSVQWKLRNRAKNASTLAAAISFADRIKEAPSNPVGETPSEILGSKLIDFSLSLSATKSTRKSQTKKAEPPEKQIPADIAKIFQDPQALLHINFNSNPEVILQVIDCGGHPMYLDIIPRLVGPRCIYCIVYNLMWRLDDFPVIEFWRDGNLLQQKVSTKTYLEHVVEWISVIDSQYLRDHNIKAQPTALFIGTHFDLFVQQRFNNDRMEARIAANSMFEQVKAAVQDKLCCCKLNLMPHYVDNTTAGTSSEDVTAAALRSLIEQTAREYSVLAMPISWLCMLHYLQYYSTSKQFVHIGGIKEAAAVCGVRREELELCLQMFHHLSMLFYFHHIEELKGYVFTDLNWFFQELGKLFMAPLGDHYENGWRHLQRTGIVTNQLQSRLFEREYIKGWCLRILGFLGLAGGIERGNNTAVIPNSFFAGDQVNYKTAFSLSFVPSMIEASANSPPRKEYLVFPNGEVLSPLFFVFSPNDSAQQGLVHYIPPGFLTHLISRLTESDFFSIVLDARDQPSTPSFNNQFTFTCGKLNIDDITIRGHGDCIQVTVERKSKEDHQEFTPPSEVCADAYRNIYSTCQLILLQWFPKITIHPCFFCRDCSVADHFAILHNINLNPPTLSCTRSSMVYSAERPETLWFKP